MHCCNPSSLKDSSSIDGIASESSRGLLCLFKSTTGPCLLYTSIAHELEGPVFHRLNLAVLMTILATPGMKQRR
jgi:hypothetical protein